VGRGNGGVHVCVGQLEKWGECGVQYRWCLLLEPCNGGTSSTVIILLYSYQNLIFGCVSTMLSIKVRIKITVIHGFIKVFILDFKLVSLEFM
jgi:hypothetical protein